MISFRVKHFSKQGLIEAVSKDYNNFTLIPKWVQETVVGQTGRLIWVPDNTKQKFSMEEIMEDFYNKGGIYRRFVEGLLEETE